MLSISIYLCFFFFSLSLYSSLSLSISLSRSVSLFFFLWLVVPLFGCHCSLSLYLKSVLSFFLVLLSSFFPLCLPSAFLSLQPVLSLFCSCSALLSSCPLSDFLLICCDSCPDCFVSSVGFGKRGLLEKGSFQKGPFSRDSGEFRDSRDSREPPDCGKERRIRPFSRDSREFRDFRDSRDSSNEKTPFVMTPFSGPVKKRLRSPNWGLFLSSNSWRSRVLGRDFFDRFQSP